MPEADYVWLPREDILQFEELETLVDVFVALGVDKVRLTGGEPLLRRDVADLVARLARRSGVRDLAMTTNGVLLAANAESLERAGLHRLTVSLDTLHADRFRGLTRYDELDRVLAGIAAAAPLFPGLKIDTVVIRGTNDDELVSLIEFGRRHGADRTGVAHRVRPAPRRRSAVHRVHGCWRRDALVDGPRGLTARDVGSHRRALR